MQHSIHLGRLHGIDIAINWSWLIIFALLTWSLAVFFFPSVFPFWSPITYWWVAAISTILLFVSVLLHELSHSLVAQAQGIEVTSITLFIFGGVSNIRREPRSARDEFLMAFAGPATSFVIGLVSYGLLAVGDGRVAQPIRGILIAMAFYNVLLAVFNLIPGFPLDGGRVFRAIVWGITGDYRRATTIATGVGHVFAFLFILLGLFLAFTGEFLSGIWLIFIGWFLNNAATLSQRQAELETSLRGVSVRSAMRTPPPEVPADTPLQDFVDRYVLSQGVRALPVVADGDRLTGMITLAEVREFPRDRWATTRVADAMLPVDRLTTATPDEPLVQALRDMSESDVNQLPVVDHGHLVGLLTRSDVIKYIQVRQELGQRAA